MCILRIAGLVLTVCIVFLSNDIKAQENVFQAGASISEITPFLGASIVGDIKSQSPFTNTFTIELANGSNGYLTTPEQHKLDGDLVIC